jgi:hypothetical protein
MNAAFQLLRHLATALLVAGMAAAAAPPAPDARATAFRQADAELGRHIENEIWLDRDAGSPARLERQWRTAIDWLLDWLDHHENASTTDITAALKTLRPDAQPSVLALGVHTYLIAGPGPFDTVFIADQVAGHYRLSWHIAHLAPSSHARILRAWQAQHQHGRRMEGPMYAQLGSLPPDANGMPRFYIDATYAELPTAMFSAQVSVWRWNGHTAVPLLAHQYGYLPDQPSRTRVQGQQLIVGEKRYFAVLFACSACLERQTDWRVELTAHGVRRLGSQSLTPELDAADALLASTLHRRPLGNLASRAALTGAQAMIAEALESLGETNKPFSAALGMLAEWSVVTVPGGKRLCLTTDNASARYFWMSEVAGGYRIDRVEPANRECAYEPRPRLTPVGLDN